MKEYVPPPLLPLHIYSVELLSFTSRWDEGDNRTHRCPCNNNIMHHLCKQQQKKRGMKWWFYGSFPSSPVLIYIFLNDKTDEMECKIILQTDSTISLCGGGGGNITTSSPTELFIIEGFSCQINQTHKNATVQKNPRRQTLNDCHFQEPIPTHTLESSANNKTLWWNKKENNN